MDAPSSLFDLIKLKILFLNALNTPFASTPGCLKNSYPQKTRMN